MKRAALILALSLVLPAPAAAAPPEPFGHDCTPQNGVLFCPTASDAQRVPSWDGVPLDVDVTLPATGDGPFPTIVMHHGLGGRKQNFEATTPEGDGGGTYRYNNNFYARRGYAVVNLSARGFGRSCGSPDSRTSPACDRGWMHLSDQRFEARDTQYLLGLLADQGVTRPDAIGVTGVSYGGGLTQSLARLRDRVKLTNGSLVPWTSPAGRRLSIAAAYSRWGWSDLVYSLLPNGRFLDFRTPSARQSRTPPGVMKQSFVNGLYALVGATGYLAPAGADPTADLTSWKATVDRGEPYRSDAQRIARELASHHSAVGLSGVPAPLLIQNGWTDDLFPVSEALRTYRTFRRTRGARVSLQFGDLGHGRGGNKPNADRFFHDQAAAFFDAHLRGRGKAPAHNAVTAFTQTCPKTRRARGPYRASRWERLRRGTFRLSRRRGQRVRSSGGDPATGKAYDQVAGGDACLRIRRERARGTAVVQRRVRRGFTMLGLPTVRARIRTRGSGGMLAARLWDVSRGRQTLISRGVYRLRAGQRGRVTFQLFGNGWRFRRGHRVKLELLGRDPNFLRTSNNRFSVRVSRLRVALPTRERGRRR